MACHQEHIGFSQGQQLSYIEVHGVRLHNSHLMSSEQEHTSRHFVVVVLYIQPLKMKGRRACLSSQNPSSGLHPSGASIPHQQLEMQRSPRQDSEEVIRCGKVMPQVWHLHFIHFCNQLKNKGGYWQELGRGPSRSMFFLTPVYSMLLINPTAGLHTVEWYWWVERKLVEWRVLVPGTLIDYHTVFPGTGVYGIVLS